MWFKKKKSGYPPGVRKDYHLSSEEMIHAFIDYLKKHGRAQWEGGTYHIGLEIIGSVSEETAIGTLVTIKLSEGGRTVDKG